MSEPTPNTQPSQEVKGAADRRGLLDLKVTMSTPSPVAGTQFTVYVLVTNLFDVPIWPESPIVFLPSELQVVAPPQIDLQAIQSLDLLINRVAKGEVAPRPELKTKGPNWWQRNMPGLFHYAEPQVKVEELLKDLAAQANNLNQQLADLEGQRDQLRARINAPGKSLGEQLDASQTDATLQADLSHLSTLTRDAEKVREGINLLLQEIVILTGSSAINSDGNLLMENFALAGPLYVRAKGNVLLKNPQKARVAVLDSSLRPGEALQPGNTVVYSLALRTQSRLLFRPSQYSLQHSLNFYFSNLDQRTAVQTNTANQLLTVRAPIWAVMLGSIIGGTAGYAARCFQDACQPGKDGGLVGFGQPWWYYPMRAVLTAILSAMAIVFLARKSETQSMVSIEDFWGGLVIGFLVGYTGTAAFENIAHTNVVASPPTK